MGLLFNSKESNKLFFRKSSKSFSCFLWRIKKDIVHIKIGRYNKPSTRKYSIVHCLTAPKIRAMVYRIFPANSQGGKGFAPGLFL